MLIFKFTLTILFIQRGTSFWCSEQESVPPHDPAGGGTE